MPTDYVATTHTDPGAWTAGSARLGNTAVRPTTPNGLLYGTAAGGTTGAVEPTWPLVIGGTVVDNTVTWTCVNDLNSIAGYPIITVPVNGDTGVPQAIVSAIGMLADWFLGVGFLHNANTWTANNTFANTLLNGVGTVNGILDFLTGSTLTLASGSTIQFLAGAVIKNQGATAAGLFGLQTTLASAGIQAAPPSGSTLAAFTPATNMAIRVEASLVSTVSTPQNVTISYKDAGGTLQTYAVVMTNTGSGSGTYYPQFVSFLIYAEAGTIVILDTLTSAPVVYGIGSLTGI